MLTGVSNAAEEGSSAYLMKTGQQLIDRSVYLGGVEKFRQHTSLKSTAGII